MARRSHSRPAAWISAVAVVVLAVVVGVLVIVAIDRSRPAPTDESLAPIPTFAPVTPSPSPSPTPTLMPLLPLPRAEERFLTASSEGVLWRGIAGSCADGTDPLIERSTDGGGIWDDVTPLYRGLGQIARLDAFAGTQAQTIALLGDDCSTDGLRTFTQGRFWESYEEVLAESSFIAGNDAGEVVTPQGAIAAPCDESRSLRGAGGMVALVCNGQAYRLVGDQWQALGIENVVAVATAESSVVIAHIAPDCAGLALSTVTDTSTAEVGCALDADPAAPTAIEVSDSSIFVWSGANFADVAI